MLATAGVSNLFAGRVARALPKLHTAHVLPAPQHLNRRRIVISGSNNIEDEFVVSVDEVGELADINCVAIASERFLVRFQF